jgi:hypothetical protein
MIDRFKRIDRYLKTVAMIGAILLLGQSLVATDFTTPTMDISFECSVGPIPELGKEFTISVTFWFNEKVYLIFPR